MFGSNENKESENKKLMTENKKVGIITKCNKQKLNISKETTRAKEDAKYSVAKPPNFKHFRRRNLAISSLHNQFGK